MVAAMCTLFSTLLISGTVYFDSQDDGTVRVTGTITGLSPGEHAFHIHAIGVTDDCYKARGHFDTANKSHGGPTDENRHVGDLGNIVADATGTAVLDFTDSLIALTGTNNIIGRSVMIHSGADTLGKGKPPKSSAVRVACGKIVDRD
ncbi:hypothetical protein ACOMHN_002188 [Nucella lapillus]